MEPTKPKAVQHTLDEEIDQINRSIQERRTNYDKLTAKGETAKMDVDYQLSVLTSAANRLKALRYLLTQISNPF